MGVYLGKRVRHCLGVVGLGGGEWVMEVVVCVCEAWHTRIVIVESGDSVNMFLGDVRDVVQVQHECI